MLSAKSLTIGAAVLLLQLHGVRADGAQEWTEAGFPAMAFIFGLLLIIMAIVKGYLHTRSAAGIKANAGLFATSWLVWFWAIFLIFGPGSGGLGSTTAANPTLVLFNTMALLGCASIFSFSAPVWNQDSTVCYGYFAKDLSRCKDNGYLEWLRIVGFWAIFTNVGILTKAFMDMTAPVGGYPIVNKEASQPLLSNAAATDNSANIGSDVSYTAGYSAPPLQPTGAMPYTSIGAAAPAVAADTVTGSTAQVY